MKLLLATLHSRYSHASLALPCLAAVCADIEGLQTVISELTVNQRPEEVLASLVNEDADIIAFSCYIWNIGQTLRLAAEIKLLNPETFIIVGGPEVSFGSHELMLENPQIDAIIRGEGEGPFRRLMTLFISSAGRAITDESLQEVGSVTFRSGDEIISSPMVLPLQSLDSIPSPFATDLADLSKPLVYAETSRGCPFSCSFCLSSTENSVRSYSQQRIEQDLLFLMQHGVATIKLVDRTFNFDAARANRIWQFILDHNRQSRFHFEIAADLLTDENFALLRNVPTDRFRFEIGVQSTSVDTLADVGRKSDLDRLFANVRRLRAETDVTVHLDLVAGLPGEDLHGFRDSLERVLSLGPNHIQIEPLKMLKGTAIRKSAKENGYRFSPYPPYRILQSRWLAHRDIGIIEDTAEAVETLYNSGHFTATLQLLARQHSLAKLFTPSALSRHGGRDPATRYAGFYTLAAAIFPDSIPLIKDALRFDYCMAGYPGGKLPEFLLPRQGSETGGLQPASAPEIAARLSLQTSSRFRSFKTVFERDYSQAGWPEGETVITFVYPAGKGTQKVLLLPG